MKEEGGRWLGSKSKGKNKTPTQTEEGPEGNNRKAKEIVASPESFYHRSPGLN
jgi:hypothetical protein